MIILLNKEELLSKSTWSCVKMKMPLLLKISQL